MDIIVEDIASCGSTSEGMEKGNINDSNTIGQIEIVSTFGVLKVRSMQVIREFSGMGLNESRAFVDSIENNGLQRLDLVSEISVKQALEKCKLEGIAAREISGGLTSLAQQNNTSVEVKKAEVLVRKTVDDIDKELMINMVDPDRVTAMNRNDLLAVLTDIRLVA